jgi:hypothetical protein
MALTLIQSYINDGTVEGFDQGAPNHRFEECSGVSSILPGHFYTAKIPTGIGNSMPALSIEKWQLDPSNGKPYSDQFPIFLALNSLDSGGQSFLGLNIKLIPRPLRKLFLREYLRIFFSDRGPIAKAALASFFNQDGEILPYNERLRLPDMRNLAATVTLSWLKSNLFRQLSDLKFNFLVDRYNRMQMQDLKLIDWHDVSKIGEVEYSTDPTVNTVSSISDYLKNLT